MDINVYHDNQAKQFSVSIRGESATLRYLLSTDGKVLDYYSTFVPPTLRGKGVGQALVRFALEYAKKNQLKVKPTCPFVKTYVDAHQEYLSLMA